MCSTTPKRDELEAYLAIGPEEINGDVLDYWRLSAAKWPNLAAMARDYLPIPATSAASERSFSTGRDLLGLYRQSLLPDTMEHTVCLRSWLNSKLVKLDSASIEPSVVSLEPPGLEE